jgi:hypothetical protein
VFWFLVKWRDIVAGMFHVNGHCKIYVCSQAFFSVSYLTTSNSVVEIELSNPVLTTSIKTQKVPGMNSKIILHENRNEELASGNK